MTGASRTPMRRILCSIAAARLVLNIAACDANTPLEPTVDRATQQFNELKERPDIDQAVARYEEMYTSVRQQLTAAFPFLQWQQTQAPGGAACGSEFAALDTGSRQDAVIRGLGNWMAPGNLPDAQWDRAVSIVDTVVRSYGFNSGPIRVVNRPSDHEVDFYDSYQAELVFGTAVNTTMTFITGCHLTAEAKKRGYPAQTY
ncbi:MAG: LppA family lipoprotein [Pseudonocardiaceae bacterium]